MGKNEKTIGEALDWIKETVPQGMQKIMIIIMVDNIKHSLGEEIFKPLQYKEE